MITRIGSRNEITTGKPDDLVTEIGLVIFNDKIFLSPMSR